MSEEQEPDSAIFRDALLRTLLPDPGILTSEEDEAWWETMQRGIPWDIGELTYDNAERLVSRSGRGSAPSTGCFPWWFQGKPLGVFTFRNALKIAPPEVVAEVVEALYRGGFTEAELGIPRPAPPSA